MSHWLAGEAGGVAGMTSLAGGMAGAGAGVGVVVVEVELLVDVSVDDAGGLSRLSQADRPPARNKAPSRPAKTRVLAEVGVVMVRSSSTC
jgi:hypothetical protein